MKILFTLAIVIVTFLAGYHIGYQRAYQPLNDKLQNIQAEDWQFWNKLPANQKAK